MQHGSRERMRQFIKDQLGEHPEGLTSMELIDRYGPANVTEQGMFIGELMSLRIHGRVETEIRTPPGGTHRALVNKYTASRWLAWVRNEQEQMKARALQDAG